MKKQPQETADDKMLGKVIAAELRQQLGGAESDCPETETVAAFYDRTLIGRERDLWEKHFLHCMRCQEYLAELARLADADEPPAMLGEQVEKESDDSSPGWFYRLAWVLPFLVIGVISASLYKEDIERFLQQHQETALNAPASAPPADQLSPGAGAKGEEKRASVDKDLTKTAPAPAAVAAKNKAGAPPSAPSGIVARSEGHAAGGIAGPRERMDTRDAAQVAEPALKIEIAEKKTADYVVPPAAAPPARQSVTAEAESASTRKENSALGRLTIRGVEPKTVSKWRVGRRGTIQKADESGAWTRIVSGVSEDLFDITFAGNAGWAVGHDGTVLRSTDGGETWNKVSTPVREDLVHVSSQNAQQAQVISRSGKTFTTTDGGQTWK